MTKSWSFASKLSKLIPVKYSHKGSKACVNIWWEISKVLLSLLRELLICRKHQRAIIIELRQR
jgi:hypothetical protein